MDTVAVALAALTLAAPQGLQHPDTQPLDRQRAPTHVSRPEPPRAVPGPAFEPPHRTRSRVTTDASDLAWTAATFDRHARVFHDVDAEGTLWARGRDYKASANAEGFTFIPFLGSDAPRNYPVRYRLVDASREGFSFVLDPDAAVTRDRDRILIDRGDVEVRYDLSTTAAEQSFHFDLPGGSGDLTLTIDVETELDAAPHEGGFRFTNDRGGVTYGETIVFDATGASTAVAAAWNGGAIELVVPASFLTDAVAPIVVDPISATFAIDTFDSDLRFPDVAYDPINDRYCVVFNDTFSSTDEDVYSWFVDAVSGLPTLGTYLDATSSHWRIPEVAYHRYSQKFLTVCVRTDLHLPQGTAVVGRFRHANGALEPQQVIRPSTASFTISHANVGSESVQLAASYFCIPYVRSYSTDTDVRALFLDSSGNQVGSEVPLATQVSHTEYAPEISRSTGTVSGPGAHRYNIAWRVYDLATQRYRIDACQLSYGGATMYGPFTVHPFTSTEVGNTLRVTSLSPRTHPSTGESYYLIAYSDDPDGIVALCSETTIHQQASMKSIVHSTNAQSDWNVVATPEHFIVAYQDLDVLSVTVAQPVVDRLGVTERRRRSTGPSPNLYHVAAASAYGGGSSLAEAMVVFSSGPDPFLGGTIHGAIASADTALEAAGSQFCFGEPNSTGDRAFIQALGDRQRASPHWLRVEGLPPNAFGFFLASTTGGITPNAGGSQGTLCLAGSIGRFTLFNSGTGSSQHLFDPMAIAQPTGAVGALAGQIWGFQCWHRDSVGGAATSNFTNAVLIPFL